MVTKRKVYPRAECEVCNKTYSKVRDWQRFCSDSCRMESYKTTLERQMRELEAENALQAKRIEELEALLAKVEERT